MGFRKIFGKNLEFLYLIGVAVLLIAGAVVLVSCSGNNGGGGDQAQGATIVARDAKGVWFITDNPDHVASQDTRIGPAVASLYEVFRSMGYLVAQDRLWQMETYRRTARGTTAEVFGPNYLTTDIMMRTVGYSDTELQTAFDGMNQEIQDIISGYVEGINEHILDVLADDAALLPFEFKAAGFTPAPWTVIDILAWVVTLQRNFDPEGIRCLTHPVQLNNMTLMVYLGQTFGAGATAMFNDLRWLNDPTALTYIPPTAQVSGLTEPKTPDAIPIPEDYETILKLVEEVNEKGKLIDESLKKINAKVKMGSYAWVISGAKTESGNPIIYSGPQMGFEVPSIVCEGSIRAGGLNVSGMTVPGIPGIIIGRTPHHAWSMQVGHAHTVDFYLESTADMTLHRQETFQVAGGQAVTQPIYRTARGPVIAVNGQQAITWKYSHWNCELNCIEAFLDISRAQSMDEFGAAIEKVAVCQHYCYADRDGNIGYWMAGRDPQRPDGEWRFAQGFGGAPLLDWDASVLIARSTDRNTTQGFYGGWNNKSNVNYNNCYNNSGYVFGPFHRAHVVNDYLNANNNLTFEQVRDLALNIATTDSFGSGGTPWNFADATFTAAVQANPTAERTAALDLLHSWDGHFVNGGQSEWVAGTTRADAWVLMDAWLREVVRLTFEDELGSGTGSFFSKESTNILYNVILRGIDGRNNYDWFSPFTLDQIIVTALDNVLATLGARPWNAARGNITYNHSMLGQIWTTPFASRSTYAHVVEYGVDGPVRIESMFPLGESGDIQMDDGGNPVFNDGYFGMTPEFDGFAPRNFPLFD